MERQTQRGIQINKLEKEMCVRKRESARQAENRN